jgi:hypothetical protein
MPDIPKIPPIFDGASKAAKRVEDARKKWVGEDPKKDKKSDFEIAKEELSRTTERLREIRERLAKTTKAVEEGRKK